MRPAISSAGALQQFEDTDLKFEVAELKMCSKVSVIRKEATDIDLKTIILDAQKMKKSIPMYRTLFPDREMSRSIIKAIGYFATNEKNSSSTMKIKQSFGF